MFFFFNFSSCIKRVSGCLRVWSLPERRPLQEGAFREQAWFNESDSARGRCPSASPPRCVGDTVTHSNPSKTPDRDSQLMWPLTSDLPPGYCTGRPRGERTWFTTSRTTTGATVRVAHTHTHTRRRSADPSLCSHWLAGDSAGFLSRVDSCLFFFFFGSYLLRARGGKHVWTLLSRLQSLSARLLEKQSKIKIARYIVI